MVMTTAGQALKLLWVSGPLRIRTDAHRFEAALKSYIKSRNGAAFERCTGLYSVLYQFQLHENAVWCALGG